MKVIPGIYKHFKGGLYKVIDTVTHSETEQTLVLYKPLYDRTSDKANDDQGLWVRPIAMFKETVEHEGHKVPRFVRVSAS
uniref:DUF1653 domain-containing protein n=1 Tax=Ningiella ruwaisensis TaxID=2364274 RepID=UPI00109F94A0|nr:DUF1653 domain-containing protein [Ningiella ruwaisensis]